MGVRIREGDLVQVVTGADKGKQGRVLSVDRAAGRVRVEKVRLQKRHLKAGRKGARTGGIIEQEGYIDASNVMHVDSSTGGTTRMRVRRDGDRRVRVFAKSGEDIPEPARS
jgi:large subunit ribosomal protein L24